MINRQFTSKYPSITMEESLQSVSELAIIWLVNDYFIRNNNIHNNNGIYSNGDGYSLSNVNKVIHIDHQYENKLSNTSNHDLIMCSMNDHHHNNNNPSTTSLNYTNPRTYISPSSYDRTFVSYSLPISLNQFTKNYHSSIHNKKDPIHFRSPLTICTDFNHYDPNESFNDYDFDPDQSNFMFDIDSNNKNNHNSYGSKTDLYLNKTINNIELNSSNLLTSYQNTHNLQSSIQNNQNSVDDKLLSK
ncbi:unnamed protein product [Schistosoma mattheei]|uniref:Uncharacterized protein n=1 Tax=Schistosoma mattheei TaxID=31246 RepID=A0A183NN25_9TREM|nr:unnamed protein product [Schistosoma mattheei]